jgi:hypothetical protein
MENNSIESFVKYPFFHREQSRSFKSNSFHARNLSCNVQRDCPVCPTGLQTANVGSSARKSANGCVSQTTVYQAGNCNCRPLKSQCLRAEGNRKSEVNRKQNSYGKKAREGLKSKEGLMQRRKRPVEPESVFGQTKASKQYNLVRHFGPDRVKVDFAVFAIAFNTGKPYNKTQIISENPKKQSFFDQKEIIFVFILMFIKKKSFC